MNTRNYVAGLGVVLTIGEMDQWEKVQLEEMCD